MSVIYCDIETIPAVHWSPEQRDAYIREHVPSNYKNPETIAKWVAENGDEVFARTACDWRHDHIVCIGVKHEGKEPRVFGIRNPLDDAELRDVLFSVWKNLNEVAVHGVRMHGWNCDFDAFHLDMHARRLNAPWVRFMWRDLKQEMAPSRRYPSSPWNLHDAIRFFGIRPIGADEITGAGVAAAWERGDTDLIMRHCAQDLCDIEAIHHKLCPRTWEAE